MFSRNILLALVTLAIALLVVAGCMRMGEPTDDERAQLATWSAAVSDQDRAQVAREVNTHTDWMERKKTQWMIDEYRRRYSHARAKQARHDAATQRAATQRAATMPTTTTMPTTNQYP
jgi:hypothetical protein